MANHTRGPPPEASLGVWALGMSLWVPGFLEHPGGLQSHLNHLFISEHGSQEKALT